MPDDSPALKNALKELLPTAAFLGVPATFAMTSSATKKLLNLSPTVRAANWAKDQVTGTQAGMSDVQRETLEALPKGWKLPVINIVPKFLVKSAENKLTQVFGPIAESKESQEAIKALESYFQNKPDLLAQAGFVFNSAEKTMDPAILKNTIELLGQMGPKELQSFKSHVNNNIMALDRLAAKSAPRPASQ